MLNSFNKVPNHRFLDTRRVNFFLAIVCIVIFTFYLILLIKREKHCRNPKMKILSINPYEEDVPQEPMEAEGRIWLNCVRAIQFFMVTISLTSLLAITNPFSWSSDTLVILTAILLAIQCALVTVTVFSICAQRPPSKEKELEKGNKPTKKGNKAVSPLPMYQNIV